MKREELNRKYRWIYEVQAVWLEKNKLHPPVFLEI